MQTTPIASIRTRPDRQRQRFDEAALVELATSIRERGLIHALVIDAEGTLVAGERRLRAIRDLLLPLGRTFTYAGNPVPPGEVPIVVAASSDPLELEEIELAENLQRRDLTWQEQAEAHARLHRLRGAQRAAGGNILPTEQTSADTAREIHGPDANNHQRDTVRQEIIVAAHLDKPEVAKAPSLRDAMKAIKKIEDADRNRALAEIVGRTFSSAVHRVFNEDCLAWMASAVHSPEERFDVILTDPPYGMSADTFGDAGGRLTQIDHRYEDSPEAWLSIMRDWCPLSFALAKPQAHAYIFCDIDNFHALREMMRAAGWYVFRTPFTDYKRNSGRVPLPECGPRRQTEWFLYAIKGKKPVNFIGSDLIECTADENMTHGAQKPVSLFTEILRRSVRPGDEILDTFAGTGTILPAAHELQCHATAIELNPEYYGLCLKRLEALSAQQELAWT